MYTIHFLTKTNFRLLITIEAVQKNNALHSIIRRIFITEMKVIIEKSLETIETSKIYPF